jgi:hypothetical protein
MQEDGGGGIARVEPHQGGIGGRERFWRTQHDLELRYNTGLSYSIRWSSDGPGHDEGPIHQG